MNKSLSFLLIHLAIALFALVIQTSLWPKVFQNYGFFPQAIVPLALHLFLYSSLLISIYFIYGITLLTTSLSTNSFLHLLIAFLIFYCFTYFSKSNYHWKKPQFFFISSFIWGFTFPFLLPILLFFGKKAYMFPSFSFVLLSALVTLGLSYLILPFLNLLKDPSPFEHL